MKPKDLSERIGNIDDRLVQNAQHVPNYGQQHKKRSFRHILTLAAVLALMVTCFAAGALAYHREPESIEVPETGLTLILPDSWKGKYGYDVQDGYLGVYLRSAHEKQDDNGYLFWIDSVNGSYPMDFSSPANETVIASTKATTYLLIRPSDVQYDPENAKMEEEYLEMTREIGNIKILLSDWLRENSTNAENWVEGTVYANRIAEGEVTDTIICDEAASDTIRELFDSKPCDKEIGSFACDLEIQYSGLTWSVNTTTGQIMLDGEYPYGDTLDTEELQTLLNTLNAMK